MILLIPSSKTRINDNFIYDNSIDATPIFQTVKHPDIETYANDRDTQFQATFYKKFAIDIVAETVFDYPYPFITEKTLRPIGCKRMFIILGSARSLKLLKSKGFKTFDDIIDESYDEIDDPCARFHSVANSIKDFVNLDIDYIKNYYYQNQQKFEHNFEILRNLRSVEIAEFCLKLGIPTNTVYNRDI